MSTTTTLSDVVEMCQGGITYTSMIERLEKTVGADQSFQNKLTKAVPWLVTQKWLENTANVYLATDAAVREASMTDAMSVPVRDVAHLSDVPVRVGSG